MVGLHSTLHFWLNGRSQIPALKDLGPVSRKARKAIRKTPTRLFCKAGLSYVVKGIKIKITAKFLASRRYRFEDIK